jgi:uncharacterized protein YjdB
MRRKPPTLGVVTAILLALGGCESSVSPSFSPPAHDDKITLNAKSLSLTVGQDRQLSVIGAAQVDWRSDDPSIVVVSSSGLVSAVAPGTARIVARSKSASDTSVVTVRGPIESIALLSNSVDIAVGQSATLAFRAFDGNGQELEDVQGAQVEWTSGSPTVATVDSAGRVSAQLLGSAPIVVSVDGKKDSARVRVVRTPIASLVMNVPSQFALSAGANFQIGATAQDSSGNHLDDRALMWSSSDTNVVKVTQSGHLAALRAGTARIAVFSEGQTAFTTIFVDEGSVAHVAIALNAATIKAGGWTQATATATDAHGGVLTGRAVTWSSQNPAVASVNGQGVVQGIRGGSTNITASVGGVVGSASIAVAAEPAVSPVASISVALASSTLVAGQNTKAVAFARDSLGNSLPDRVFSWASSTPSVATVSTSGVVTAVANGAATITATSDGKLGTASLTVVTTTPTPPAPLSPDEPAYNSATGVLVYQDAMDQYTSAHDMWLAHLAGSIPGTHIEQTDFGEDVDSTTLTTGRSGTGKALRLVYSGGYQDSHGWTLRNGPVLPDTTTHFFSYYGRVTVAGAMPVDALPVKWFMAWHWANRIQWATHDHVPCPVWPTTGQHTVWMVYDNGPTACQGAQPLGPYPDDVFNGQWHRFTYQYRPNSVAGSRDGIARMWVDGIKVIDISASACGTTPPAGYKTWCDVADIDALDTHGIAGYLEWGSTLTKETPPFTIDIDDFVWWRGK